jgi:hypothetical protein
LSEKDQDWLIEHFKSELNGVFSNKKWIVAMDVLYSSCLFSKKLKELGAESVLAIGSSRGVGELPNEDELLKINLNVSSRFGIMESIIKSEDAILNLEGEYIEIINDFDPKKTAKVIRTIFSSDCLVAGRESFGGRPFLWRALENKMIIDALWDELNIQRAPSAVHEVNSKALRENWQTFSQGKGVVLVGDNRSGWHGGATKVKWVNESHEFEEAKEFFSKVCDKVRVMPFIDGIPCSIHGWVFPNEVVAFRPCEMIVYRVTGTLNFNYSGSSTNWAPRPEVASEMKRTAIRVGEYLQNKFGYRGSYSVDGVVSSEGFFPTELNPRFGGAMGRMNDSIPSIPLYLIHLCCAEGIELDYRPKELEKLIVSSVENAPSIKGMYLFNGIFNIQPRQQYIKLVGSEWSLSEEGEEETAKITLAPAANGSLLMVFLDKSLLANGASAAPKVLSAFKFASQLWELPLPELEPAPDL